MGNVVVPNFVQEAVNSLDTPEQGRLLLKLLRMYAANGAYMPKERLEQLVEKVKSMGQQEPVLSIGLSVGDFAAAKVVFNRPQIIDIEPEEEMNQNAALLTK